MSDKDVPSVPVTTLAGLTSLSDLLSELPVSDSLSSITSLNKSLLFHTLVAEESNNLLSVRDDNLVKQLVHAIEQTNSDHIELKSQFAIHQPGTNISEYPELLQGIYTFRPTVFNTPHSHRIHNHQTTNPTHPQQQQHKVPANLVSHNPQNEIIVHQQVSPQQHTTITTRQKAQLANAQNVNNNSNNLQFVAAGAADANQHIQQQQPILDISQTAIQNSATSQNNVVNINSVYNSNDTPSKRPLNKRQQLANDLAMQQQQQQQQQQQHQITLNQLQQPHQQHLQQITQQQEMLIQQQLLQSQQQQIPQQVNLVQQQQLQLQQQQQQPQLMQNQQPVLIQQQVFPQHIIVQQPQQQIIHQPQTNITQIQQTHIPQEQLQLPQQNFIIQQQTLEQQQQIQLQSQIQQQQHQQVQHQQQQQQLQQHEHLNFQQQQLQQQLQKTIPRNNEYLEQQSKNFDLRGPSPAQASVAPESNQLIIGMPRQMQKRIYNNQPIIKMQDNDGGMTSSTNSAINAPMLIETMPLIETTPPINSNMIVPITKVDNNNALLPKVCIPRLKEADEVLMQQSLKKFAKQSPELAKKLGITEETATMAGSPTSTINKIDNEISTSIKNEDMFSRMKADDRSNAAKRKLAINRDLIPPEEIFSKPKVRRVERILTSSLPKTSKEEVMKSQTYQQFMRNMEQIIEQLDDTESPNFNSDDTDENIECISSKMLMVVSNDVAKLKAKGVLDSIPKNKLTLLINYAMRNVYLARNYSAGPDVEEEFVGEEVLEKILNAIEACLLICNIYSTVKDLKFLQEDNISSIVKFVQFQFRETIFPSYDSIYMAKNQKKSDNHNRNNKKKSNMLSRSLQLLYSKSVELMKVFVALFDKCLFVDTIVLALSTLAVEPFFVDNIETLQFVCLELVTTIFRKEQYVKMRSSILSDILASIDRLVYLKKNLRPFKLANNGGNIQMVTALVLQLIQCATVLPDNICGDQINSNRTNSNKKMKLTSSTIPTTITQTSSSTITTTITNELLLNSDDNSLNKFKQDKDLIVLEKYDTAVSIGGNFLTTFLSKCKSRLHDVDFRPLFENFIHDLLATVNKPEWPAAELLLSLLGTLLVKYMSDKTIEQTIRLASLDYLGIVAARLRKETVESRCKVNTMDQMIKCIKAEQEKEGDLPPKNNNIVLDPDEERIEFLQKILLDFLAVNAQEENLIWDYARHFYLSQWYRDVMQQRKRISEGEKGYATRRKNAKKRRKKGSSGDGGGNMSDTSSDDGDKSDENDETNINNKNNMNSGSSTAIDQELNLEIFHVLAERKKYLLSKIKPYSDVNCTSQHIKTYIDYNNAHLIAQYLASKRPFSQSFDKYLQKIILVVREPTIAIRTRAMKCLANIVEVDPLILKRKDMQMGVNQKFLDTAISVREAAVDLIGKYVLSSSDLIHQYYDMLSTRILDTGVSVRKRVIKILRDICIEYPDFEKIPEICVKMIRRVNDEEAIQKLVTEVFMRMWFTPCRENDRIGVHRKITQIIDVVNTAHDTGTIWLDGLLNSIFAPKENNSKIGDGGNTSSGEAVKKNTEPSPEVVLACQQLADGLVERLIQLEDTDNTRMLGCITTIHLLAKVRPQLLVRHAITIEPYLNIRCHSTIAPKFISSVAEILEQVVPLMEHPSDSFLADLEEHLMVLVVSLNQTAVLNCLSCLGGVVNKITKNYKLIRDCFSKFYKSISMSKEQLVNNPNLPIEHIYHPIFRRSLYTIGIFMRFFDFTSSNVLGLNEGDGLSPTICDDVFDCLMYFITCPNFDIRKQALVSLGHFCVQNDEYLTRSALRDFYRDLLSSSTVEGHIKTICMRNIWMYLTESELYMHNKEKDWHNQSHTEDLKEMNDVSSGMASRIIQLYLPEILNCFLHQDFSVRLWAVKVIQIVLRQGLVHPVRMVPYLICLSTDDKQEVAHRADALLKEIDRTYPGFVNMKLQQGLHLSFQLQEILQSRNDNRIVRGYTIKEEQPASMNDFLYTLLRNTKPQRRALVQTVTKQFDDQKTTLRQMLYLADNLAYFPYMVQDEPLYLIHQIDIMISVTGTNLLANFKEGLKPRIAPVGDINDKINPLVDDDDDDDEDKEMLFNRLPDDTTDLQSCITSAQGCMLMLVLKQHLKDMYGITDGRISRYSPSESNKIHDKAVTRKQVSKFNPKSTVEVLKKENVIRKELDDKEKRDLIDKYLDFKQLMLKLDPEDSDSQNEDKQKLNNSIMTTPKTPSINVSIHTPTSVSMHTNDSSFDENHVVNNFNNTVSTTTPVVSHKEMTPATTPSSRNTKSSRSTTTRKQPARSKRKKRKIVSSDEEDSDYSDEDYA